jgi:RNA polymerase sigma-70 factor (ECF subfamily)
MQFDRVEKEFGAMIRRIAVSYEADRGRAEELVQDIWLALWRALPAYRQESSLRTFVARIASYCAINHVRRGARMPRAGEISDDLAAPEPDPEQNAIGRDRRTKLLGAVRILPLPLRQVALLTLEGLAPREIAAVLGITANAVTIRLSRARDALRKQMGEPP